MYYRARFDTSCECCGKRYFGLMGMKCPENNAAFIGEELNSLADSADAALTRKRFESNVRAGDWKAVEIVPKTCPNCGKYQTWNPMYPPKKPATAQSDKKGSFLEYLNRQ